MGDLFGICGSTHYLLSESSDEAYSFDSFGGGIGKLGFISAYSNVMNSVSEVDIISIIGVSGENWCELFLNGRCVEIPMGYLDVYAGLPKKGRVSHLVYRISHKDLVTQVLIPYKKGFVSEQVLHSGTWSDC